MSSVGDTLLSLLPHRAPIAMLQRIIALEDDTLVCEASVDERSALADQGVVPGVVAIEMAAQACAALETLGRRARGESGAARQGYLVGARSVTTCATFRVGQLCRVQVTRDAFAPPLALFKFDVASKVDGAPIASGMLSAFIDAPPVA
ncbi:MAG: hypothetical protein U0V87_12500 [Acidobacteriota bacterium]